MDPNEIRRHQLQQKDFAKLNYLDFNLQNHRDRRQRLSFIEEAHPSQEIETFSLSPEFRANSQNHQPGKVDEDQALIASLNNDDPLLWIYPPIDIGPLLKRYFPEYYWTEYQYQNAPQMPSVPSLVHF